MASFETSGATSFSCSCGKKYKWKRELAGKRVRCACGATVTVPAAIAAPPPLPPPRTDRQFEVVENDFGLGPGIAPPPVAPRATTASANQTPFVAGHLPMPSRLDYRGQSESSQNSSSNLTDPVRDIYVPAGMVVAGFLGFIIWVISQSHFGPFVLSMIALFVGLETVIKTAVIIGLALVFAPRLGISFGLLRTAILKFAGIIVFSDAVLLWVETILRANGGISQNGKTVDDIFWVILGCTATVISAASYYLFSMDMEEIATFAIPMAIVSRVVGFILNLVVIALLAAVLSAASAARSTAAAPAATPSPTQSPTVARSNNATTAAAAPGAANTTPADATETDTTPIDTTPVDIVPTAADRAIALRATHLSSLFWEGPRWAQKKGTTDGRTSALVEKMIAAGAAKTYIELKPAAKGTAGEPFVPGRMFVELPNQKGKRQACYDVAIAYLRENEMEPLPTTEPGTEQFLTIKLKY